MIVDCFTFFNELDLLELRLEELNESVDYFVLVEASKTQSLLEKPFHFEENKSRYSKFLDKIIHIKVEDCPDNNENLWTMENFQRNCISRGLERLNLHDEDWVLISDLDEIPKSDFLKRINEIKNIETFSLNMIFSAYFLNLKASHRDWIGTVASKYKHVKNNNIQYFRNIKDSLPFVENSGWHFSWLGGYEKIYEKAKSCIEPFDKSTLPSKEYFETYFNDLLTKNDFSFFIHLENLSKKEIAFNKVEMDGCYPLFVLNNLSKFKKHIL
jgi:beta-1,4-mannosyl-glycoprotein beta-1,4-N-acetylglucosaminyltransferase